MIREEVMDIIYKLHNDKTLFEFGNIFDVDRGINAILFSIS